MNSEIIATRERWKSFQILHPRRGYCAKKLTHTFDIFDPALKKVLHTPNLWSYTNIVCYIAQIYRPLLHQPAMDIILMQQTVQQTLCCTIGIMDVRHVNPLHLFPKTIIRAQGLVRLVMSPFHWWRTHDFLSKILCWPFYWHPPLFFC